MASPSFTAQPEAPASLHIASHGMQPEEIGWPAICCRRDDIGECVWLGTQAGAFGWAVWPTASSVVDLNTQVSLASGERLQQALDINTRGDILAGNNQSSPYLLIKKK